MSGNGGGGRPGTGPGPDLLLTASQHFLNSRNFDACRKYALRAQATDPTNLGAAQILSIADVLSSAAESRVNNCPNWYSILGLGKNSEDPNLIKTRVDSLSLLLNPSKNKIPLAGEAFGLVRSAWAILSDPVKKAQFDSELGVCEPEDIKIKMEGQCGSGSGQEGGVDSGSAAGGFGEGGYLCRGFIPVGFEEGGKGFSSWNPFGPTPKGAGQEELEEEKTDVPKGNNNGFKNMNSIVEISDDSDDELMGESNGEKLQGEGLKNGDGITDGCGISTCKMGVTGGVVKPVLGRKKTVARNTKKVMRKGIKVKMHRTVAGSCEGVEMGLGSGENDGNLGCGIAIAGGVELGSWGDSGMEEIQFFEGLDDVFVGLQDGF
ncbi:hypothetical protein Vadar_016434 [Vaccinium darrowii]|uniref:Uncharacterized protein n=1 Tax=Vaccinium darrowii TaxID=229202 RepID=A0ACB7XA68_9ERIC|nr:hypothetical protein Vadar_016434 [Vaccinium darrowii]